MHPQIALLIDLQDVDLRLGELQGQLNRYPQTWEETKSKLLKKTRSLEAAQTEQTNRVEEKKKIEQDLRASCDKLKQYQAQQMMVKTAKELTAISAQIDGLKTAIQRLEGRGEEILSTEEDIRTRVEAAEKDVTEFREKARKERDRIREQVSTKTVEMKKLEKEREGLVPRIDESARDLYEKTRKRWPDDPVVSVRNGSCTGCNFAVLPNRLVALHLDEDILRCDHCGRILSHDETFVPAEHAQ